MGRFRQNEELSFKEVIEKALEVEEASYIDIPSLTAKLIDELYTYHDANVVELTDSIIAKIENQTTLDTSDLKIYQECIQTTADDYQDQIDQLTKENNDYEEKVAELEAKIKELTNE